jgi:quercetin dioxygenase-like cupin family protein
VYILDGEAMITISGKLHQVKQGQMVVMPTDVPHALNAEKKN